MSEELQNNRPKEKSKKEHFSELDFGEKTLAELDTAEEEFKKVHEAEKNIKKN